MRLPILYTMSWPDRVATSPSTWPPLDFIKMGDLTFKEPDLEKYPALSMGYVTLYPRKPPRARSMHFYPLVVRRSAACEMRFSALCWVFGYIPNNRLRPADVLLRQSMGGEWNGARVSMRWRCKTEAKSAQ